MDLVWLVPSGLWKISLDPRPAHVIGMSVQYPRVGNTELQASILRSGSFFPSLSPESKLKTLLSLVITGIFLLEGRAAEWNLVFSFSEISIAEIFPLPTFPHIPGQCEQKPLTGSTALVALQKKLL